MNNKLLRFSFLTVLCVLFGGGIYAALHAATANETLTVDFEGTVASYTDWTFTNIKTQCTNAGVTPHGGSYFGNTDSKTTGSIVTNEKIASPTSIQFFVSKESTNSNAATWYVKVSADGTEWTTVGDGQSAASMAKGEWVEVNRDLTSYSDVYVGIFYEGNTAKRDIDDVTLSYIPTVPDNRTATTVTFAEGYATSGAVGTQIDLPTATVSAGETVLEATVTWRSSNEDVAEIAGTKINLKAAGTAVITASYAGDTSNKPSSASYTVTAYAASYTSLAALQEAVTATSTPVQITFNNVYVTKVSGSNAYLADADGYGALIYTSGHGLTEGKVLNGTTIANLVLYNGYTELAGFSSTGLEITDGEYTPIVKTIDALTNANQCAVVTLNNVTYDATNATDPVFSDGTNTIKYYDKFSANPTLEDGAAYDVTGIIVLYKNNNNEIVREICPRTADDVVEAATVDPAEITYPVTATWDFTANANPRAVILLNGTEGTLASNVEGIELSIDARNGKFDSQTRTGDAHIPTGTIIKVPVNSTSDKITIVGNWKVNYTIGAEATPVTDLQYTYNVTAADVQAGYVAITSTSNDNYFYSISVLLNEPEEITDPVEITYPVTATWDFTANANPRAVILLNGTEGTLASNVEGIELSIDARNGKFDSQTRTGDAHIPTGTIVKVPVNSTSDQITIVGNWKVNYTIGAEATAVTDLQYTYNVTAADVQAGFVAITSTDNNNYFYSISVLLNEPEEITEPTGVLYSWDQGTETGGEAVASDGVSVGYANTGGDVAYTTIRLNGKNDYSGDVVTVTLDKPLKAGDKIKVTGYRNKDTADKETGFKAKFDKGGEVATTNGLYYVNLHKDATGDSNYGTEPNTEEFDVPTEAAGSTVITMTRAFTSTNLFVTKLVIETEGGDEPVEQDITATWNFAANCANLAPKSEGGTYTETTMASDVDGISMNIVYNGGQIKNNDNSYYVGNGVEMQIPVKNAGDVVTVVGYPGYYSYSVAGTDATEQTTVYTAKSADATKGYVPVVSTGGNNYYMSISVLQKAQSSGPTLVEKSIYKTDFSEWEALTASLEESNVAKKTKFTNENLNFTFFNTGVNTGDYDESRFPNNNGYRIYCPKKKDNNPSSYVTTSALANITKVRFVHGATGGSRGYKLEAKGDGDEDWVVISDSYASPNGWCEVTKPINKTNCQLRFTNLAETQYAYIFELEIFGNVDLSGAPLLETMTANGKTYNADDIFEMANSGNYEATIELASSETMPSAENPVTATAANGEIGTITYATEEGNTIVTIPVTADNNTANYVATFTRKPMLTLTYIGVDGTTELGTQQVEKDAPIGEFAVDIENVSSLRNGYKARGWFKQNYVGEKYTTASTFSENANLYAVETEIEVPSTSRDYEFNLADQFFYAEDHEAFSPQEGASCKFHDPTHGWSVYNGDKIDLLVGPKAIISVTTCKYGKLDNILVKKGDETLATLTGRDEDADGAVVSYNYEGEAGTLTLEMAASGEGYIHSVKIANIAETNYEKEGNWFMVKAGDVSSLIDALEVANGASGNDRQFIFLPNGTYDLGTTVMTTISGSNISLIGESMEGVIIKNRPVKEGINDTPTLVNTGSNNYFQDLTIDCLAPWGGSAERGVALSDKGNNTICKNVYLKGLQDTYVSNNASGTYYFEDGKIEGSVDYVCGYGDVYFNKVRFYTVNKSTGATGGCIAAPNTLKSFGYIFNECTLDGMANEDGKYRLARPWAANTIVRMLNTTMIIKPNAAGWGEWSTPNAVTQFGEYNSLDADGNPVDVSQRATTIGGQPNNPVITAEEAATYAPDAIFSGEWKPFDLTVQCEAPEAELKDGTITWTPADNGAIAYMVSKNGQMMAITTGTSFVIDAVAGNAPRRADAADKYTIRAANPRGGFGEAKEVKETATGISTVKNGQQDDTIYNMQGVRVNHVQKGVYIVNGKKVVVK